MIAMHMANELLTPSVAGLFIAIAVAALGFASWRTHKSFEPEKVPLMGVLGAFVFAGQMINFPVLPGTSGHLVGAVMLAILLGPHAATLTMAAILIIQCLIFQDGGLLALGTNIINMGVLPCYLGYTIYCAILGPGRQPSPGRLYGAAFVAALVGVVGGATLVPVETQISGVITVPFITFLSMMIGVHLLIGTVEGLITFAVIAYLHQVRPDVLGLEIAGDQGKVRLGQRAVLGSFLVAALLLGGLISFWASKSPDGLESVSSGVIAEPHPTMAKADELQAKTAPLPNYEYTGFSGVVGSAIALVVVGGIAMALRRRHAAAHAAEASHAPSVH